MDNYLYIIPVTPSYLEHWYVRHFFRNKMGYFVYKNKTGLDFKEFSDVSRV